MIIRDALQSDIPGIQSLEAATTGAAHWPREAYQSAFEPGGAKRLVLVAEDLSGFLVGLCAGPEWEIENIAVAASVRRRGIGAQLIRCFLHRAQAAGAAAVWLEVRDSNRPARAFYEKFGFRESGCRPGYYLDPKEDAVLYKFNFKLEKAARNR